MEERVPPRPGRVRCLRCPRDFDSPDRCRIRICPGCRAQDAKVPGLRSVSLRQVWGAVRGG